MKTLAVMTMALAVPASAVSAEVLYSNFGPGDTYSLDMGATLSAGGPLGGQVNEAAVPFTVVGGNYYLDTAEIAILLNFGPDLVWADICADDNGAPGAVLETTSGTGVTDPFVWAPPMVLTFSGTLELQEGETYWLAVRPPITDYLAGWAINEVDDFGLRAWRIDGGEWNTAFGTPGTDSERAVFRINGTLVPAPGALMLAGLACAGARRRRRQA